jgi:YD repeat-containing protein
MVKLYRTYACGDNLNLTGITDYVDVANGISFGYSPANRLASSLGPWGDLSFTHDGVGNRTSRTLTQGGSTTTDVYGYPTLSNRIANALTNGIETRAFAHDAADNLTQDLRGGITRPCA